MSEVQGRLRLTTRMTPEGGAPYEERHAARCRLRQIPEGAQLFWSLPGAEAAHYMLTLSDTQAHLVREGETGLDLSFAVGQCLPGRWTTPYGDLPIQTRTTALALTQDPDGGVLRLSYVLLSEGTPMGEAELEVLWRI